MNGQDPLAPLVPSALRGDTAAERTLLSTVGPSVLAIVRRLVGARHPDVEDLCQESSVALLNALPNFRGQCSVVHFACRVTLFTVLAARRGERRRPWHDLHESAEDEAVSAPGPSELLEQRELQGVLRELLDEIPMHQSEVLALHVVLGHTIEEITEMTECNANTLRSRLHRGLEALREKLAKRRDLDHLLRGFRE